MLYEVITIWQRLNRFPKFAPPAVAVRHQASLDRQMFAGIVQFQPMNETEVVEYVPAFIAAEAMKGLVPLADLEGRSLFGVDRATGPRNNFV